MSDFSRWACFGFHYKRRLWRSVMLPSALDWCHSVEIDAVDLQRKEYLIQTRPRADYVVTHPPLWSKGANAFGKRNARSCTEVT